MAETNLTVFTTKLVDLTRLEDFWGKVKQYILAAVATEQGLREAADEALSGRINTEKGRIDTLVNTTIPGLEGAINTEKGRIDTLVNTTIPGLETSITNITKNGGTIDTKIAALNPTANDNTSMYATNVQVVNGKIKVDYKLLPEGADWQPAINTAKGEAIEAANTALETHAAAKVSADANAGGIHVTADDRTKWDSAATKLDTFLAGADLTDHLFDTLKEIQGYIDSDGNAADVLVGRVDDLEDRADNLEAADQALGGRIDTLTQTVSTNKAAIEKTVSDLDAAYKLADQGLSGRLDTLEAANEANTTAHAGFTSSIEAIQNLLNGMSLATTTEVEAIVK